MVMSDPTGLVAVTATSVWASGGADCAAPSDATVAASDSARPASGAVTWPIGGTDCATPSDTTAAVSGRSRLGAVVAACSATTKGTGATADAVGPANEVAAAASLLPKIEVTPSSVICPS